MAKDSLKDKFNLSRAQLDVLIATLNHMIKTCAYDLPDPHAGICYNLSKLLLCEWNQTRWHYPLDDKTMAGSWTQSTNGFIIDLVRALADNWPGRTSHKGKYNAFPVPRNDDFRLWEGPNLTARIDLMRYLAKRLRDWRRRTPA
jgi:hypothetical protein